MGTWYGYRCQECGYSADVSGGEDVGMSVQTQTGYCLACKKLVDYVTKIQDGDGDQQDVGICDDCKTPVKQKWYSGDPCPRCGGSFDETGKVTMWD